ncbi:MAG TPA: PspC domain-containing protein, partial [Acidimicrobiales bacterium]|nr:PspC domain-containing protein [Acidimicrobiales bacterium]
WRQHRHMRFVRFMRGSGHLRRSRDERLLAGVAGGISARTGIDVTIVRVVFVVLGILSGAGAVIYILMWLAVPLDGTDSNIFSRAVTDRRGIGIAIAAVPAMAATAIFASAVGAGSASNFIWPFFLASAGGVLVYRNADDGERAFLRETLEPVFAFDGSSRPTRLAFVARIAVGVLLGAGGVALIAFLHEPHSAWRPVIGAAVLWVAVVVVFGPWWLRLMRELGAERRARIRAEERADVAARVHDSVLQTLALIQRSAEQPQVVAKLARRQERELRSWLFEGIAPGSFGEGGQTTLAAGVKRIEDGVEEAHGVAVHAVTVGDCPLDDDLEALLSAGREATVNAAKWSGAAMVDLFVEVEDDRVSMFVRDRGIGFERQDVAPDRRGLAESIEGRMARHGGTATIRSSPGAGTEVELVLPRRPVPARA